MAELPNIHPGEVLQEDFLEHLGLSAYRSPRIWISLKRVYPRSAWRAQHHGRHGNTPWPVFRTSAAFWLKPSGRRNGLEELRRTKSGEIERIRPREDIPMADTAAE
ncbi:MAG: addiction module antidote protein, HigA family [Rhodovibrio sp.]|nr:addiction module antidote protein, HigA family [Rhodovibrio sp.]